MLLSWALPPAHTIWHIEWDRNTTSFTQLPVLRAAIKIMQFSGILIIITMITEPKQLQLLNYQLLQSRGETTQRKRACSVHPTPPVHLSRPHQQTGAQSTCGWGASREACPCVLPGISAWGAGWAGCREVGARLGGGVCTGASGCWVFTGMWSGTCGSTTCG